MKYLNRCATLLVFVLASKSVSALPMIYTFEGTMSGFESYHQDYDIGDFGLSIGVTPLRYIFEIDFDAEQSIFSNTAGTWYYFYSELIEGSVINGHLYNDGYYGFNWHRLNGPHVGQITSSRSNVRIDTTALLSPDWRVQDWKIGQAFKSTDLGCFRGGRNGCAVYAYGNVTLTSIAEVPTPGTLVLVLLSFLGFASCRLQVRKLGVTTASAT